MANADNHIPSDDEIWQQVDVRLASLRRLAPFFKKKHQVFTIPTRDDLFAEIKGRCVGAIERQKAEEIRLAEELKIQQDADALYLELRKAQSLPIYSLKEFQAKYPKINIGDVEGYSQEKLISFLIT